jgi:mercuric ion binding protein
VQRHGGIGAIEAHGIAPVVLAAYPLLGSGNTTAGSSEAEAKATLHLKVTGMDCKECTSTIANRIKKVPGVVSATVDFESGDAIVRYDGREGMESAAINAVEAAGFHAEAQREADVNRR